MRSAVLVVAILGSLLSPLFLASGHAIDPPDVGCGPMPADSSVLASTATINPVQDRKALVIFIKMNGDTTNPYGGSYTCADSGGWPHNKSRALPTWTDSLLSTSSDSTSTFFNGSLTDYFAEMSKGAFWLYGDIYNRSLPDSITGCKDSAYVPEGYVMDDSTCFDSLNYYILYDIDRSKAGFSISSGTGINFANYDHDGDGFVDALFMVYKTYPGTNCGYQTGYSGVAKVLTSDYETNDPWPGHAGQYIKVPFLLRGGSTMFATVNKVHTQVTMAHELGHSFFDYFAGGGYQGQHLSYISQFGLMDGGGSGNSTAGMERSLLGWVTPKVIGLGASGTGDTTVTVRDCVQTGDLFKVLIPGRTDEYFLFENRQRKSYYDSVTDSLYGVDHRYTGVGCVYNSLRATGLVITHIDSLGSGNPHSPQWSAAGGRDTTVARHKYVDVECADGLWRIPTTQTTAQADSGFYDELDWNSPSPPDTYTGDRYDTWREGNGTAFTDTSNPNTNAYNQSGDWNYPKGLQDVCTGIRLYDIVTNGDSSMTVKISYLDDSACVLSGAATTDRAGGISGIQMRVCPRGDGDTLRVNATLANNCESQVVGYPGAKLTVTLAHGDTVYSASAASCTGQTQFYGTGETDAFGQIGINVRRLGGHGAWGANDITASLYTAGRQLGSNVQFEVRSPDINARDGVNLTDFGLFGASFYGTLPAEYGNLDFTVSAGDSVNLTDFALFGDHFAHGCP